MPFNIRILWNLFKKRKLGLQDIRFSGNSIRLDVSSICQLQCPCCPQSTGAMQTLGKGFLSFDNFKKLLNKNPEIKNIEISNWGEIFLNPEFNQILAYAHQKGVTLDADSGVNLNTVADETMEALVKFQLHSLRISIDGATPETYQLYRRGGNFNRVIQNIKTINSYKKQYTSRYPLLTWQFVIFGHNQHEIEVAHDMARGLEMDFVIKESWARTFSPLKNVRQVSKNIKRDKFSIWCAQFWSNPQIHFDGKLLGCCCNLWGDFGNVFEEGLKECIESKKYQDVIKMLLGRKNITSDMPCLKCRYQYNIKFIHNSFKYLAFLSDNKTF